MNLKIAAIQGILGAKQDGIWGPISQRSFDDLVRSDLMIRKPAPQWPFETKIEGDDILVPNGVITCFGGWGDGIADPQDNGETASGVNTRTRVVNGVSIPMDGRQFSSLSAAEHRALDGCPIPRLKNDRGLTAWHTPVEITIDGFTFRPPDGIVDLGPGFQASRPGEPHILDLTVPAASIVASKFGHPGLMRKLATTFSIRGSYRIVGGAKLGGLA